LLILAIKFLLAIALQRRARMNGS